LVAATTQFVQSEDVSGSEFVSESTTYASNDINLKFDISALWIMKFKRCFIFRGTIRYERWFK